MDRRLYLRAFEYEDLSFINKLQNCDAFFHPTCGNKYFISSERDRKWIEDKIFNNYNQLYLMICTIEDDQPIGYVCTTDIDYINRKAELAGIVITEEYLRKGYGAGGMQLIMKHMYCELGMNVLYGFIIAENTASLKMMEKLGFHKDGLVRSYIYKQDKFHDAVLVSMLKEEFETLILNI